MYEDNINSYYATEFIKGGTLKEYIKQKSNMFFINTDKITEK